MESRITVNGYSECNLIENIQEFIKNEYPLSVRVSDETINKHISISIESSTNKPGFLTVNIDYSNAIFIANSIISMVKRNRNNL